MHPSLTLNKEEIEDNSEIVEIGMKKNYKNKLREIERTDAAGARLSQKSWKDPVVAVDDSLTAGEKSVDLVRSHIRIRCADANTTRERLDSAFQFQRASHVLDDRLHIYSRYF